MDNEKELSVQALQDIKAMMERSAKFITLSGWSGIWAGAVGLAGAYVAFLWMDGMQATNHEVYLTAPAGIITGGEYSDITLRFIGLALTVLLVAVAWGLYFTCRKTSNNGAKLWNSASRRMLGHMAVPMVAGGMFCLLFLSNGHEMYIAPACLLFYGLALINGSKYTLSDIRYLGYSELGLGFINMFLPGYGLTFWALGFGVLHILYGVIMWNKYDNRKVSR